MLFSIYIEIADDFIINTKKVDTFFPLSHTRALKSLIFNVTNVTMSH